MVRYSRALVGLLAWTALTGSAQAHIKLLKPASWLNEDDSGGPQKGGPCGPGGFDDVQPVPHSMAVTTVTAGDMLMVEFEETIHHPGWFRISLAQAPNDFEVIEFPNTNNCNYDLSQVPTEPHGNVLADGLGMDMNITGPNRKFMELVKLPDTPCEKCTLQVIQVMADALHAPPDCIYYHCAELTILPKSSSVPVAGSGGPPSAGASGAAGESGGAAAGSGGASVGGSGTGDQQAQAGAGAAGDKASASAGQSGSAGMAAAPVQPVNSPAAQEPANSGCSITRVQHDATSPSALLWLSLAALGLACRPRRR